ncbi:MAG: peptide deformylase [Tardiphaga sp.]|nr:peptide deformylase [Tardiphaga sp.]
MAIREIIILPDKQLRLVSKPVDRVTSEVRKLADDMLETMYDAPGIGLAAIQIAVPLRLITMDLAKRDDDETSVARPRVFINPEIVSKSDELSVYEEGCLSIPEYYEAVERPAKVRFRFLDLDGKTREEDAEGLFATCIQHEIDHLNGVLFVDYLSKLKRDRVMKKFTKFARRAAE